MPFANLGEHISTFIHSYRELASLLQVCNLLYFMVCSYQYVYVECSVVSNLPIHSATMS